PQGGAQPSSIHHAFVTDGRRARKARCVSTSPSLRPAIGYEPSRSRSTTQHDTTQRNRRKRRDTMAISKASAQWDGPLKTGKGVMKPAHAPEIPFSAASRFEGAPASNPEEVIGAALAGCFSMALSLGLEKAGATPKSIRTIANVKLDREGDGF